MGKVLECLTSNGRSTEGVERQSNIWNNRRQREDTLRMSSRSQFSSRSNVAHRSKVGSRSTVASRSYPASRTTFAGRELQQGQKRTFWNRIQDSIPHTVWIFLALMMTLVLFFAAIGMTALYLHEVNKTAILRTALGQIKTFTIDKYPSVKGKNDREIFAKTQMLADELATWTLRTIQLEAAVDDISTRLQQGWKLFNEAIYLFNERYLTFDDAKEACHKKRSALVCIESTDEEDYLEHVVRGYNNFWIGIYYNNYDWICHYDGISRPSFWWHGFPTDEKKAESCVLLPKDCFTQGSCWVNSVCTRKIPGICKKKPDKKWYT